MTPFNSYHPKEGSSIRPLFPELDKDLDFIAKMVRGTRVRYPSSILVRSKMFSLKLWMERGTAQMNIDIRTGPTSWKSENFKGLGSIEAKLEELKPVLEERYNRMMKKTLGATLSATGSPDSTERTT